MASPNQAPVPTKAEISESMGVAWRELPTNPAADFAPIPDSGQVLFNHRLWNNDPTEAQTAAFFEEYPDALERLVYTPRMYVGRTHDEITRVEPGFILLCGLSGEPLPGDRITEKEFFLKGMHLYRTQSEHVIPRLPAYLSEPHSVHTQILTPAKTPAAFRYICKLFNTPPTPESEEDQSGQVTAIVTGDLIMPDKSLYQGGLEDPLKKSLLLGLPWREIPPYGGSSLVDAAHDSNPQLSRPVQLDPENAPTGFQIDQFFWQENRPSEVLDRLVYRPASETGDTAGRQPSFLFITGLRDLPPSGQFTDLSTALTEVGARTYETPSGTLIHVWEDSAGDFPESVFATQTVSEAGTTEAYEYLMELYNNPDIKLPGPTAQALGRITIGEGISR